MTMQPSLYRNIPADLPEELLETLVQGSGVRIERIVSRGHCSPPDFWYNQDEHEWVTVLKGEGRLRFKEGDRLVHLCAGDWVNIAAGEEHRVEWTKEGEETVWLAVFYAEEN